MHEPVKGSFLLLHQNKTFLSSCQVDDYSLITLIVPGRRIKQQIKSNDEYDWKSTYSIIFFLFIHSFIHSFISLAFQFSKTKGLLPKQTLHFPTAYQSNVVSGNNTQCMLDERASGHRLRLNPVINMFMVMVFWHLSSTFIRFTHISIKHSLRVDIRYRSHTIRGSCSSVDKKYSHLFRRYRKTLLNEFLWGKGASLSSLMMKKSDWSTASATWLTMELKRKNETWIQHFL